MRTLITTGAIFLSAAAQAQTITITDAVEREDTVEITVETDIVGPIEVMAGVDLFGQKPDDVFIGATERLIINRSPQTLTIPILEPDGGFIPAGAYEATVSFYPWWGADEAPAETQALTEQIDATLPISIEGSGEIASEVQASRNAYAQARDYVMSLDIGQIFDGSELAYVLGAPERLEVMNRNGAIVGWYYEMPDMTVFQNTNNREIVTWRDGKQNAL